MSIIAWMHSDKLVKGMIVQMGHNDFRTVTGIEISWKTGNAAYFMDNNPIPYVLDGYVNVRSEAPVLVYAGETHAKILDALETEITDEQWEAIEASAVPIRRNRPAVKLGAYFPGFHGVTELGW